MQLINRFDSTIGVFTVPPAGDGFYYFSTYLLVEIDEWAQFEIQVNGEIVCRAESIDQGVSDPQCVAVPVTSWKVCSDTTCD